MEKVVEALLALKVRGIECTNCHIEFVAHTFSSVPKLKDLKLMERGDILVKYCPFCGEQLKED